MTAPAPVAETAPAASRSPRTSTALLKRGAISLGLLAVMVAAIEVWVIVRNVQEFMLPRPSRVISTFFEEWPYLWEHLRATLRSMLIGTTLSFMISFVLASLMATSKVLARGLFGILVVLKLVPTIAVAPLIVIWFGFGSTTQIVVVILATFFPMVVNLHLGLTEVDDDMVTLLRSMGAGRWRVFRSLRVPNSVPGIFTSLRTALPLSAIGAIVGEWVGASEGIGYVVKLDSSLFRTKLVFAELVTIGLAGVILFGIVAAVESRVRRNVG